LCVSSAVRCGIIYIPFGGGGGGGGGGNGARIDICKLSNATAAAILLQSAAAAAFAPYIMK